MTKTKTKSSTKKNEPLKQASKEFRLLSIDTEKMPVELSQEERDRCAIELAELVEQKEALNEEKRDVTREWRVKLNAKQEEIDDCAAGVIRGAKPKAFSIETRAVYKTRMVERVRAEDGKVIEKRPMTPDEEVQYLQTAIDDGRATPHTLDRDPSKGAKKGPLKLGGSASDVPDTLVYSTGPNEPTEEEETDELGEDERDALGGLPRGWPKKWIDARWKVDGDERPLTGGDIREVHLRVSPKGSMTADLATACEPVGLTLPHVQRACALLLRRKIITSVDGVWFAVEDAPEAPSEPGRKDPLPEASVAIKPKRRGAKDTGELAINAALGQSEAMEAVH